MEELLRFIINELTGNGENAEITVEDSAITVVIDKADMGRVIGRQGRIARAIRTIVKASGAKSGVKYNVEIKER